MIIFIFLLPSWLGNWPVIRIWRRKRNKASSYQSCTLYQNCHEKWVERFLFRSFLGWIGWYPYHNKITYSRSEIQGVSAKWHWQEMAKCFPCLVHAGCGREYHCLLSVLLPHLSLTIGKNVIEQTVKSYVSSLIAN